jgi:hypothetical protein
MPANRPTVSRDTRLLLTIVVIAFATLWILARVRFPDRVTVPTAVSPVLAQLSAPSAFDSIATAVDQLRPRIRPLVTVATLDRHPLDAPAELVSSPVSVLRLHDNLAVALLPPDADRENARFAGVDEIGRDRASGLVLLRVEGAGIAPVSWEPRRPDLARFFIASDPVAGGTVLQPVFVGGLRETTSPVWQGPVWGLPATASVPAGSFLFTLDGQFAGVIVDLDGHPALASAPAVIAAADRIASVGQRPAADIGIEVQAMTPELARGMGASYGVVVTWVDPAGPAADLLAVADVIEGVDGRAISTVGEWRVRAARLNQGDALTIRVRRGGDVREVPIIAAGRVPGGDVPLGLTLRTVPRVGAVIDRVAADSPADRAGLRAGDLLTLVGSRSAPTASQALRAFAAASNERPIVIGFTRDKAHHVIAMDKQW